MQHVKTRWLRVSNYSLVGASLMLYIAYFLFEQLGVSQATKDTWGITPLILTIAFIHAVYVLITDRLFMQRFPWVITVISFLIYGILHSTIIETSGNTNILYRITFGITVFFSGMLGLYPPITALIVVWTVLGLTVNGILAPTNASLTFNVIVDSFLTLAALGGWAFFRKYYEADDDQQTRELTETVQQEQFKSSVMLESITDGVMIISPKGTVEVLNASAAQMLGWDREEATKLDYRSLIETQQEEGSGQKHVDAITASLKSGKSEQQISLLITHHERQLYVDIVASPIYVKNPSVKEGQPDQKLVGLIAILRNVDEQKRQEQQRSDFISTASHEMRTPVASIQGFIELALNPKVATVDDKARGYLEKAHEATKHLGELFQDLLTVSKSEDGRLSSNPEIINVNEFLTSIVEQETPAATQKNLQLHFEEMKAGGDSKSIAPLLYVHADPERLREVIFNLIENAIKYTPSGMITVGATMKDKTVIIRIADTGMGIAQEDLPHIFQKFYRIDNSSTREIGGTGLGLYICKEIITAMQGRIWAESEVGTGSTFFVELPRISADEVQRLTQQKPEEV